MKWWSGTHWAAPVLLARSWKPLNMCSRWCVNSNNLLLIHNYTVRIYITLCDPTVTADYCELEGGNKPRGASWMRIRAYWKWRRTRRVWSYWRNEFQPLRGKMERQSASQSEHAPFLLLSNEFSVFNECEGCRLQSAARIHLCRLDSFYRRWIYLPSRDSSAWWKSFCLWPKRRKCYWGRDDVTNRVVIHHRRRAQAVTPRCPHRIHVENIIFTSFCLFLCVSLTTVRA